jgi:propanediol utilization protein
MNLTQEQVQAINRGEAVSVTVEGTKCMLVREEVYSRVQRVFEGALDGDTVYDLIDAAMSDDDANDPGLESYQRYR